MANSWGGFASSKECFKMRGCSTLRTSTAARQDCFRKVEMTNVDNGMKMAYTIVNPHEANLKEGKISIKSPIADALLGKRVNETVEVRVPAGILRLRIDRITV